MEIDKMANQNPWWIDGSAILKDEKVKKVLDSGSKIDILLEEKNQVLIGPRQLGKTTALKYDIYKKIINNHVNPKQIIYYSFDTSRNFEEISDVINTFVGDGQAKTFLYLDEVSFVEGWQRAIKSFLDSGKSSNSILYVTGSSSINLKKELMPGRGISFVEFMPLSFRQFLVSFGSAELKQFLEKNIATDFDSAIRLAYKAAVYFEEIYKLFNIYLKTGGYPDAILNYVSNKQISDEIYDIHWNAFVSDVSKADRSIEIATAVIYGIIESYASKVNLSKIAQMQGIKSHVTVREYIEMLDDLFVVKSIFPIAGRKYVFRKERKIYFNDPFLYNLFAKKLNVIDKDIEPKIVEGILYNHLYRFVNRRKQLTEPKVEIGFYTGKREVDFIAKEFGFEAKWQNDIKINDFPEADIKNKVLLSKKTIIKESNERGVKILPLPLFIAFL
ncbi:MAG: ATP-binding protein [Thermodesulfobium sp.]